MIPLTGPGAVLAILIAAEAHAASAPEALKGKSVIVTWSETRQQRHVGEPNFYAVNAIHNLSVYVSTAGRVFSRATFSTRAGTGTIERAPREGGGAYPTRMGLFGGQTMTLIGETKGGARRTLVEFDPSFSSCRARVALVLQPGMTSVSFSPITRKYIEIKSMTASGVSCSVKSGNILAGAT